MRELTRWGELTRLQDERGLTTQEGRELLSLRAQLDAVERASIAALTDDYAQLMNMGDLGGVEW